MLLVVAVRARYRRMSAETGLTVEERLAKEIARRKYVQVSGRYIAWGYTVTPQTDAEWNSRDLMGVVVYDDSFERPYDSQKVATATFAECDGDREATEQLAIDRAIARTAAPLHGTPSVAPTVPNDALATRTESPL